MSIPLMELYQDESIRCATSRYADIWQRDGSIERSLERAGVLGSLATQEAVLAHVESLPLYDRNDSRERAARVLGCIPASMLLHNFGEEVTAWTVANDVDYRSERLREGLEDEGYDSNLLEKARMLAWSEHEPPTGRDVLKQNAVMEGILGGKLSDIDLDAIVQKTALPDITLSSKRLSDYRLAPLRATPGSTRFGGKVRDWDGIEATQKPGIHYSIWLDTPTGFVLNYKNVPQATIGVVATGPDTLEIRQMQRTFGRVYNPDDPDIFYTGIRPPRGLMPLDWQKSMISITSELAILLGKHTIGIRAGKKIPSSDCHMNMAQAKESYDVPAKRLGFRSNQKGDWELPIVELHENLLHD